MAAGKSAADNARDIRNTTVRPVRAPLACAKQSCIKAALGSGKLLAAGAAAIRLDLAQGLFRAELPPNAGIPSRLPGRIACDAAHCYAGVWWPQAAR
ncbi:MAG: hypothetical protein KF778_07825 [Rhodocyclaceae bacterium]|nr:hypothetical protein [Rhodocyclaceae bacterium]MBX3668298.1 hypothetical protein [Rhodocyclaceae bacterium]